MDNLQKDMQFEDNYIGKRPWKIEKKKKKKWVWIFNLKGKNDTENKATPKNILLWKTSKTMSLYNVTALSMGKICA